MQQVLPQNNFQAPVLCSHSFFLFFVGHMSTLMSVFHALSDVGPGLYCWSSWDVALLLVQKHKDRK